MLVFGICGCLRCNEILNMKFNDVEDLGNRYLVTVAANKNDYSGQFIIGNLFYATVKKYIELRPKNLTTDRFFIHYVNGKCTNQHIGIHKIGEVPRFIAEYCQLPNADRYTGHCFRRSSATLASDSGASLHMIKQLGRWRSDAIAEGYIENSLLNRELNYNNVVQQQNSTISSVSQFQTPHLVSEPASIQQQLRPIPDISQNLVSAPSTSTTIQVAPTLGVNLNKTNNSLEQNTCPSKDTDNVEVNWQDFEEIFELPSLNKIPSK